MAHDRAAAEAAEALERQSAELAGVLDELRQRELRIAQLELVADGLSDRVVERERQLAEAREELEPLRAESASGMRSLVALAVELEAIRGQARGQATRIRMRAMRDAVELAERMAELERRPPGGRDRLIDALREGIARLGDDRDADPDPVADTNGRAERPAAELFDGVVEIEVGPLGDVSQLVGFEDAAGGIAETAEISVRRFASGRATLEMRLAQPVELLRELEERSPFEFRVRDRRFDRLVLDVDDD